VTVEIDHWNKTALSANQARESLYRAEREKEFPQKSEAHLAGLNPLGDFPSGDGSLRIRRESAASPVFPGGRILPSNKPAAPALPWGGIRANQRSSLRPIAVRMRRAGREGGTRSTPPPNEPKHSGRNSAHTSEPRRFPRPRAMASGTSVHLAGAEPHSKSRLRLSFLQSRNAASMRKQPKSAFQTGDGMGSASRLPA